MTLRKKSFLVVTSLLLLGVGFGYAYVEQTLNFTPQTDAARIAIRAEVSAQDETAFYQPPQSPLTLKGVCPTLWSTFGYVKLLPILAKITPIEFKFLS